jgi:CheY-like chemotaxis protein
LARILVADDEKEIRTFTNRTLTHEGHDVTLADDGELAIERARAKLRYSSSIMNMPHGIKTQSKQTMASNMKT